MHLQIPPELEADLFTGTELVALQTGAAQNLAQTALDKLSEKFKNLQDLVEEQKKLVPLFNAIQEDVDSNKKELTRNQQDIALFSQCLSSHENTLEELRQRLSTQENNYRGVLGFAKQSKLSVENLNTTLIEIAAKLDTLQTNYETLDINQSESIQSILEVLQLLQNARIPALETKCATLQSSIIELFETEKIKIFKDILDLVSKTVDTKQEANTKKITALEMIQAENLQQQTIKTLQNQVVVLERQHTFFKWIGGSVILALMLWMWSHTHHS